MIANLLSRPSSDADAGALECITEANFSPLIAVVSMNSRDHDYSTDSTRRLLDQLG